MSIPLASKASGQVTVVDVTDAYSVLLTSESYTFVGNTTGAPTGLSCVTQVVAYCGTQQCSKVSVSTVTCPTGISATISNNNTSSPTITFKTTATITQACEAAIPVVVDGVTINKKFSFAVAKQGTQGDKGSTGKGISSVTPQYYISTSKTSITGGSWSDTAPTNIEKGEYLWTRMKLVYTNPASTEYTTATYDSMTDSRIEQLEDSITLTVSGVNSTATEALNKATSAKEYIDAVSTQYGYPYSTELIIYGARTDYYYPVYFGFGNQSIPREILVSRWYGLQAPSDWNTSKHAGSLTFRIKAIFGGWGGVDYQCEILDFSEKYSTIVGDVEVGVMDGYGLCIWLRGGGTTGAKYNVHSDQPLEYTSDSNDWHAVLPYIGVTTGAQFGWHGGTESSPKHSWTAAAPLTSPNTTHLNSLWALKTATTASSRIEQLKDSITLSVTDGTVGNTAKIKLGIDNETREANIDLTSAVTFSDLSTAGSTTINGSNITTGTLSADLITTGTLSSDRLDTSALFANDITATGKIQFDNGRYSLLIDETSKKISLDSWGELYMEGNPVRIHSPVGYITLSAANGINLQTSGDLTIGDKKLESGYWTPTLSGMSAYSYQKGRYFKFGDIAIVSFSIWGIMAGSNTSRITISGCPLVPADGGYSGGGSLSGYYTTDNTVFTNWAVSTDGCFYAYGQIPGSGNKWESSGIYQKTSGECGGGGTIMFKTSS